MLHFEPATTDPPPMQTYIDAARELLEEELPNEPDALRDMYLLLVLTLGESTTTEDVHDAWAVWSSRANPGHNSLVPFSRLEPAVAGNAGGEG